MTASCRLAAVGLACSLGSDVDEVWPRLRSADGGLLTRRDDLVKGTPRFFGQVLETLPEIPAGLERYACRNNRIAMAC